MEIENHSPFPHASFEKATTKEQFFDVVVVAGTFGLEHGQPLYPLATHRPIVTADRYVDEFYPLCTPWLSSCVSSTPTYDLLTVAPNDGGQRRVGSTYSNSIRDTNGNVVGTLSGSNQSPADMPFWLRAREYYHFGNLVSWAVHAGQYAYAALDMTAAYNNYYSMNPHTGNAKLNEANTSNRSVRAIKAVRHMLWVPRGKAAYTIIYDQAEKVLATA